MKARDCREQGGIWFFPEEGAEDIDCLDQQHMLDTGDDVIGDCYKVNLPDLHHTRPQYPAPRLDDLEVVGDGVAHQQIYQ